MDNKHLNPCEEENLKFWNDISKFYQTHDIAAWQNLVPFHITNNPLIAKRLAKAIILYVLECRNKGYDGNFTIIEAGGGLGKFAFLFLKHLTKQLKLQNLDPCLIGYYLCDRSEKTISFWQRNPQLKPFIDSGILSCQQLYVEKNQEIFSSFDENHLKSQRIIFIGNYFLDSLHQNPFILKNDQYFPCKISVKKSLFSSKTSLKFTPDFSAKQPFSNCPFYQDILDQHRKEFKKNHVLMPDSPMILLKWLNSLSLLPVFCVFSDKGFTCPKSEFYCENFNIVNTGTYASSVNFYAISQYTKLALNGSSLLFKGDDSYFGSCFFLSKDQLSHYPSLFAEAHDITQSATSLSVSYCQQILCHSTSHENLWDLLATFSILNYDLTSLSHLYDHLSALIEQIEDLSQYPILSTLNAFRDHFYFTPNLQSEEEIICLIRFSLITKQFQFCQESLRFFSEFFGENYHFHLLYGTLLFLQSDYASASSLFQAALLDNPDCQKSKEYLQHCLSMSE